MNLRLVYLAFASIFVIALFGYVRRESSSATAYDESVCEGPRLRTVEAREAAMEAGYTINRGYDCIDKKSFESVRSEKEQWDRAHAAAAATAAIAAARGPGPTLAQARRDFRTTVSVPSPAALPVPRPPADLFVRSDYTSVTHETFAAFITPDPKDGRKHPAIAWLTGGDSSSLDDFWTPGPDANDQSAHAFRDAGIVMLFPTLRGGNGNAGGKEYFYGEVDDVLAAADHLAQQPYVDPQRIYLGGHSTGGTLALLTAETSGRFAAVFAFGVVTRVDRYPPSLLPLHFDALPEEELKLRSPIHWLHGLISPTYVIEGKQPPGNFGELQALCAHDAPAALHCIPVEGRDHFSALSSVSRVIAARLVMAGEGVEFTLRPEDFKRGN
jgi:hypothetical protein